jgi:hypothetical protein
VKASHPGGRPDDYSPQKRRDGILQEACRWRRVVEPAGWYSRIAKGFFAGLMYIAVLHRLRMDCTSSKLTIFARDGQDVQPWAHDLKLLLG